MDPTSRSTSFLTADTVGGRRLVLQATLLLALPGYLSAGQASDLPGLNLPVMRVAPAYPPYADFCRRKPDECRLTGTGVATYSLELMAALRDVSRTVNHEIRFARDIDNHGIEDYWSLPTSGYGDCEDLALEKRSRLSRQGYPRGSMRLTFVADRTHMTSHCVLTVDTTRGTFLLDSHTDDVKRWREAPYNFEARERQDGRWDRYDQSSWRYDAEPARP